MLSIASTSACVRFAPSSISNWIAARSAKSLTRAATDAYGLSLSVIGIPNLLREAR